MAKIFSSREDPTDIENLQDLVFAAHDVLDRDEDPSDDPEEVQLQLQAAVMDMVELIDTSRTQVHMLSMDLIQLSLNQAMMARDLKTSLYLIESLAMPVNETEPFLKALALLKRDADPEITTVGNSTNGIEVDVKLTFSEEELAEALKLAIGEYIALTAEHALS